MEECIWSLLKFKELSCVLFTHKTNALHRYGPHTYSNTAVIRGHFKPALASVRREDSMKQRGAF